MHRTFFSFSWIFKRFVVSIVTTSLKKLWNFSSWTKVVDIQLFCPNVALIQILWMNLTLQFSSEIYLPTKVWDRYKNAKNECPHSPPITDPRTIFSFPSSSFLECTICPWQEVIRTIHSSLKISRFYDSEWPRDALPNHSCIFTNK